MILPAREGLAAGRLGAGGRAVFAPVCPDILLRGILDQTGGPQMCMGGPPLDPEFKVKGPVGIAIDEQEAQASVGPEGGEAFVAGALMLRQSSIPLPVFLWRTVLRNLINLGHHVVIVVAVLCYVGHFPEIGRAHV